MSVTWTKSRVVNFSEKFARPYVEVLVALDGRTYDQAFFHKLLADAGVVDDVDQTGDEDAVHDRRAKRWDSYLGKIREFGLGFTVEEKRIGGPGHKVWRVSAVARDFSSGALSYRQLMALQLMRFQLPKASMPIQGEAREELLRGVRIRPLGLMIQALDWLSEHGALVYLSWDEIFGHLTQVETHEGLAAAMDSLLAARNAEGLPVAPALAAVEAGPAVADETHKSDTYGDIWLNEFERTGYLRQLKLGARADLPAHVVVRSLPRWEEARGLNETVPLQEYSDDNTSINEYFDFFSSSPSLAELEVLRMDERVVEIQVGTEGTFDVASQSLRGSADVVGGLLVGALVVLAGDVPESAQSTVFEVVSEPESLGGTEVQVTLRPVMLRTDGQPVSTD